jgi:hypothetical protein
MLSLAEVADCVGAEVLDVKPKTTGGFYREDAVRLASEAARTPRRGAPPLPTLPRDAAAPAIDPEERGRLKPRPASNQNLRTPRPMADDEPDEPRSRKLGRTVAWVLLAPWYMATVVGTIGIDVLFIKDMLGL